MSLLVTPIPLELSHVLDSSNLSRLNHKVRGTRLLRSSASRPLFARVDSPHALRLAAAAPPPAASDEEAVTPKDPITLLSPGKDITDVLVSFTESYGSVVTAFSQIFSFPFLENLQIGGAPTPNAGDEKPDTTPATTSTRDLFLSGNTDFHAWADFEKQTCRNLVGYATLLSTLLKQQTPADFVSAVEPVLTRYSEQLVDRNDAKAEVFTKLRKFTESLRDNIKSTTETIKAFSAKIDTAEEQLSNLNVGKTVLSLLKNLFLLDGSEDDVMAKLAFLLGISLSALTGDFSSLYKQKARLRELIVSLQRLQGQLESVNGSMASLSLALGHTIDANDVLSDVWTHVSENLNVLQTQEDAGDKLSPTDLNTVLNAWKKTKDQANAAIASLSSAIVSSAAAASAAASIAPSEGPITMPRTAGELKLFKMAASAFSALLHPQQFNVMKRLATTPEVVNHYTHHAARLFSMAAANFDTGNTNEGDDQQKAEQEMNKQITYLGPPPEVTAALEKLSGDCKAVIQTFSNVLQIPYLDQLQILNPFKTQATPDEPDKKDIRSIVLAYQAKYQDLQNSSVDCIRGLISYSSYQLAVLPKVTPFTPRAGQLGLDTYLEACQSVVDSYVTKASALSDRYTKFGQEWLLCQNNLQNAINTAKADAKAAREGLERERERYKNQTIMGVLEIFGAIALFAIAAFTMPVGILALAGGGALLYKAIKDLQGLSAIDAAIDTFNAAIATADATEKQLQVLVAPMQKVADAVSRVSKIWSDITQSLTNIQTFMITWNSASPQTFTVSVGAVITDWGNVKTNSELYVGIITGGVPI
ncbi:hypothetical protein B0T22DRAFT_491472 [Podospora appendiculata]|uniref:Uncharacterized protein n=1 Tax=Podospora appendiculata TaxID=314037 RepID=A0AAE0XDB4_9PEZI|nr:hypothetical protein B0T22DRAFT_491472 [Podospora appendiculata]